LDQRRIPLAVKQRPERRGWRLENLDVGQQQVQRQLEIGRGQRGNGTPDNVFLEDDPSNFTPAWSFAIWTTSTRILPGRGL
jgi:hypothetical protein